MPLIDSHHHFWKYNPEEYDWIAPEWTVLRRDYLPADLAETTAGARIEGVVSVQARQTLAETHWLLGLAAAHPQLIRGVVGWVPLAAPDIEDQLAALAPTHPKLRAVRHVVQGEPDPGFLERPDFNRGIAALRRHGLVYDLLVKESQLPATIAFVDRHPEQPFVLDHIAKPRIAAGELEPWATHLRELARRPNVTCKVSGMVTEADPTDWNVQQLRRYFDVVVDAFGPARLMIGSDWPVCLLGIDYAGWIDLVTCWADTFLSVDERARFLGGTAVEVYGLS